MTGITIQERLQRIRFFTVSPDVSHLKENERLALSLSVDAAAVMTDIYLEQAAHGNNEMFTALAERSDKEGMDLFQYFGIHGVPWDGYANDEPFVPGVGEKPKFGSFYPRSLTREEWDAWLLAHPEDRAQFESNYTVIKRRGNDMVAIPYSKEYARLLDEAGSHLRVAARYLPAGNLQSFLELRADAFRSNDYFASDMAWVDTDGHPFEVTIGPYEVYFDALLGLKASFEAFIALPDKDATAALQKFMPLVPEFNAILSEEFPFRPKGALSPFEVVAEVFRGGEAGFGYRFVAYNLPNDRRVHDLKGSKKVFSRTMMEAMFSTIAVPIAERIFTPRIAEKCVFGNRLLFVLGHELAHGLGPSIITVNGREMPFEVALKDLHSTVEEAKADMLGSRLLDYFRVRGLLDDETLLAILATEIAAFFQQWMHGFTEAHARGNLVEYNWLKAAHALRFDNASGKYEIEPARMIDAMSNLSAEFLRLQLAGDYANAKAFMEYWGTIPPELPPILEGLTDIPTAVCPVYDLNF